MLVSVPLMGGFSGAGRRGLGDAPGESGDVYAAFAYILTSGGNCPYSLFTPEACGAATDAYLRGTANGSLIWNPKAMRMAGDPMVYMGLLYGGAPDTTQVGTSAAASMIARAAAALGIAQSDFIEPVVNSDLPNIQYDVTGKPVPFSAPSWLTSVLPAGSQLTKGLVTSLDQLVRTTAPVGPNSVSLPDGSYLSTPAPATWHSAPDPPAGSGGGSSPGPSSGGLVPSSAPPSPAIPPASSWFLKVPWWGWLALAGAGAFAVSQMEGE